MTPRLALLVATCSVSLAWSGVASGQGPAESAGSAAPSPSAKERPAGSPEVAVGSRGPTLPLSPLPKPPTVEVPPAEPSERDALEGLLLRITSKEAAERETASREVLEAERNALPAIHERLAKLVESSDHEQMKVVLGAIRDKAREEDHKASDDKDAESTGPDYLQMLVLHARPESKPFRDLISVVALSRMLKQIGTVAACRELVGIYSRFGEFLRIEMQRDLTALGDKAVASLVEATRHPAPKIAHWALRQLDALGKAIPGEAVQVTDPEILSDVLRAYGRVRDPDAARLVVSFVSSERTQIRDAARQAVVLFGEVGNWQLRDMYENVVGKKPSREWSWDRTARELFTELDRLRLAQVYVLFEKGMAEQRAGRLDEMATAFDDVLAQSPLFDRASEMVPGYLAYARAHLDGAPDKAEGALHRALRLSGEGSSGAKTAMSLLLTLEAEHLLREHIADRVLLERALELDPQNERARRVDERITRGDREAESRYRRYVGAGAIAAAGIASVLLILLRRKTAVGGS